MPCMAPLRCAQGDIAAVLTMGVKQRDGGHRVPDPSRKGDATSRRTRSRPTAATSRRSPSSATATTAATGTGQPWTGSACAASWASCSGAGSRKRTRGARALRGAELLSLSPAAPRRRQRRRRARPRSPRSTSGCPPTSTGSSTERLFEWAEGARRGRRVRPHPRPRDSGALLLHRHPAVRAERDEPGGPRSAVGPGEGAGQGPEGADRAGGLARRARAAALS